MKGIERIAAIDASAPRMARLLPRAPNSVIALMRLMRAANQSLDTYLDLLLRPGGFTESELNCLFLLFASAEGAATPGLLCDLGGQTKANMTRILSALTAKKYVSRCGDPRDGRRQTIKITSAGKKVVKRQNLAITGPLSLAAAELTKEELKTLDGLLRKFVASLDKAERKIRASVR